mmetsp:Transcript_96681/g.118444  ORF Transcript_96681/g.118444 Transcript_96681/m.118444 type:complete len:169 (+) Transcript_96681:37-543(+)
MSPFKRKIFEFMQQTPLKNVNWNKHMNTFSNDVKRKLPFYQKILSKRWNNLSKNIESKMPGISNEFNKQYNTMVYNSKVLWSKYSQTINEKANQYNKKSSKPKPKNVHNNTSQSNDFKQKSIHVLHRMKHHFVYDFLPYTFGTLVVLGLLREILFGDNIFRRRSITMD